MAQFAYNNAKNASISHITFELNYRFHPQVSFKKDINPYLKLCSAKKLAEELRELIEIYY